MSTWHYRKRDVVHLCMQIDSDRVHQAVKEVDHNFFRMHPSAKEFLREDVPSELAVRPPLAKAPPGYKFAIRVRVEFDDDGKEIITRIRECLLVPKRTKLQWHVTDKFMRKVFSEFYRP